MRTTQAGFCAGMVLSLMLYSNGFGQDIRTGPLTDALKDSDEPQIKEAFAKLEAIRQKVINAKPGTDLWQTGRPAYPYLQVLADRWRDPRSEEILKQLTNSGPKLIEGELELQSLAFAADRFLMMLQDNREYDSLLKGLNTPDERVKQIREYFDAHPDLLATACYGRPNRPIVRMLLDEAEKLQGAAVIDLLVRSQLFGYDHFSRYKDALLDYAEKLGREKALAMPYLLQYIAATKNTNAIPLLTKWFSEEPSGEIMATLVKLPGAKERLLKWLNDPRPGVARAAANRLVTVAPDSESLKAVNALIERRKQEGASKNDISFFESVVKSIKQMMDGG